MLRLTRKYKTLEEQEAMIRRDFHAREEDQHDKDRFVQQRINKLKEWKAKAIQQLKFLFNKLRCAVPLSEYQLLSRELEIEKTKGNELKDRTLKLSKDISKN